MTALEVLARHRCSTWCRRGSHGALFWFVDRAEWLALDAAALDAGLVLSARTVPDAGPRPEGVPARARPWLVTWPRRAASAGTAAKERGGVERDQHGARQGYLPGLDDRPPPSLARLDRERWT